MEKGGENEEGGKVKIIAEGDKKEKEQTITWPFG